MKIRLFFYLIFALLLPGCAANPDAVPAPSPASTAAPSEASTLPCLEDQPMTDREKHMVFISDGGKKRRIFFEKYLADKVSLFKGTDEDSKEEVVVKGISAKEAALNRVLSKLILKAREEGKEAFQHFVVGENYKKKGKEKEAEYLIMPYIHGKNFLEHFNFPVNFCAQETVGAYDLTGQAVQVLDKMIEGAELVKAIYGLGFIPEEMNKDNFLVTEEGVLNVIDYLEFTDPIGRVWENMFSLMELVHLVYPYTAFYCPYNDYDQSVLKVHRPLLELKFVEDGALNQGLNAQMSFIIQKINDFSYLYNKSIKADDEVSIRDSMTAVDEFLEDIRGIRRSIENARLEAAPVFPEFLSDDQVKGYADLLSREIPENLRIFKLWDNTVIADLGHNKYLQHVNGMLDIDPALTESQRRSFKGAELKPVLAFVRVPIVQSSQEDIIIVESSYELLENILQANYFMPHDFFYETKGIVVIGYKFDELDDQAVRSKLEDFLRKKLLINKVFRFVKL